MNKPSDYIDQWGLLDKKFMPDGGDTCHREGMYWALRKMTGRLNPRWDRFVNGHGKNNLLWEDVMKKLHPHPGVLLRHSNPDYDSSDWDRMSRDQVQAMIIAMGYWDKDELKIFCKGHLKRGFIFCNNVRQNGATKRNHGSNGYSYAWKFPDITGPEIWGNIIRGFQHWLFYPLLWLFDFELLVGAILWRKGKSHNIALNHTLSQMQAIDRMPTLWSWLASKIMPVPRLIEICGDHLDDQYVEMPFFTDMFKEAYEGIK